MDGGYTKLRLANTLGFVPSVKRLVVPHGSVARCVWRRWTVNAMQNKEPSAMDCWHFIAPILPITDDFSQSVYVKTFYAFKLLEDEEKKKNGKIDR